MHPTIELKYYLDKQLEKYNRFCYIDTDPIQVPHKFSKKEDIEIAAFLTASIAWGQRKSIINNAYRLMEIMDNSPYDFIVGASENELKRTNNFVHRTFNASDCLYFLLSLRNIYKQHNGLENIFTEGYKLDQSIKSSIIYFRNIFLELNHNLHVEKHISNPAIHSAAKRLNLFLKWMVRNDENKVDLGIWKNIPTASLMLPLDVHAGNISRELGLLTRKQNDWKAVEEVTATLRSYDANDPIKYDFALFGAGAFRNSSVFNTNE